MLFVCTCWSFFMAILLILNRFVWPYQVCCMQSLEPFHTLLHMSCNFPVSTLWRVLRLYQLAFQRNNILIWAPFFAVLLAVENLSCHFPHEKRAFTQCCIYHSQIKVIEFLYIQDAVAVILSVCMDCLEAQLALQAFSTYPTIKSLSWPNDYFQYHREGRRELSAPCNEPYYTLL